MLMEFNYATYVFGFISLMEHRYITQKIFYNLEDLVFSQRQVQEN
jgi:hypothetical protein